MLPLSLRTGLRTVLTVSALSVVPTVAAVAQRREPIELKNRIQVGLQLQVTEPKGEFANNTGNGFGVNFTGVGRLDPSGAVNLRTDLGFLIYGSTTRRIDFAGTGGLVKLDLKTTSNIVTFVTGPQIGGTVGPVSPYLAALGGFSVFWTESSVEGSNNNANEPFASTTNAHDAVLAYGGAAGATLRVYNGARPIRFDFGARYLRHDDVRYLNQDRVEEAFRNNRDPIPLRGRADYVTYYMGINAVVF
jgi:hypothetical protein